MLNQSCCHMQIERRALYNSLRLNWLQDPALPVEQWQVLDYRALSLEELFEGLKKEGVQLNKASFLALAENADTPEMLTDDLLADSDLDMPAQDRIYLHIFELWRKLIPEKLSLSIFCDELDHEIYRYDQGDPASVELIQDAIANLEVILDENTDEGADPVDVFETVSAGCANDIESFLYDFITEQIDFGNLSYASELLDGFAEYVKDLRWFDFLKARVLMNSDPAGANELIRQLILETEAEPDLELNLEILSFMVQGGERDLFVKLVQLTLPCIQNEEDFQDLMTICADYFRCLDHDSEEQAIQALLAQRAEKSPQDALKPKDPHIAELLKIIR